MIRKNNLFIIVIALFVLPGCASVSVVRSWKSPGYPAKNYQHILVTGTQDSVGPLRDQLIALFTASLSQKGYAAQPSNMKLTAEGLNGKGRQQTFGQLRNNGTDAVLNIAWANKETEYYFVPTSFKYNYHNNPQQGFASIFPPIPAYTSTNEHYAERTTDRWVTGLYDVALEQPVYTIELKTDRSAGTSKQAETFVRLVMNDMIKKGIIYKVCCPQLAANP